MKNVVLVLLVFSVTFNGTSIMNRNVNLLQGAKSKFFLQKQKRFSFVIFLVTVSNGLSQFD
jgi:hypothetical protein